MKKVAFEEWLSKRRADDRLPRGPFFKERIGGRENPLFITELLERFATRPYFYPIQPPVPSALRKTDFGLHMLIQNCTPETRFFMAEEPFDPFPRAPKPNAKDK